MQVIDCKIEQANRVNTALGDRFIHLNLEPCPEEWVSWVLNSGRIYP